MERKTTAKWPIVRVLEGTTQRTDDVVALEEPLEILVGDKRFAYVTRTPGEEAALAAGLLLSEGLISSPADIGSIEYRAEKNRNRVEVRLVSPLPEGKDLRQRRSEILHRFIRNPVGEGTAANISERIPQCTRSVRMDPAAIFDLLTRMTSAQKLFPACGGAHAAALYDIGREPIAFAEDVARHNAMDKVIGKAFLELRLEEAAVCVASSRAGFEIVQKAASAGIAILATVSAPSHLAITLAERAGMTLVGFLREGRMNIYTRTDRIVAGSASIRK